MVRVFCRPSACRPRDHSIIRLQTAALPLLGFLQNEQTRDIPFTVAPNDIPAFVKVTKCIALCRIILSPRISCSCRSMQFPTGWSLTPSKSTMTGVICPAITVSATVLSPCMIFCKAREQNLTCLPGKQWLQITDTPLSWLYELAKTVSRRMVRTGFVSATRRCWRSLRSSPRSRFPSRKSGFVNG